MENRTGAVMSSEQVSEKPSAGPVTVGKVTTVYGVKGWVKVFSYTQPIENILDYPGWILSKDGRSQPVKVLQGKRHGNGLIASIEGYTDRDLARQICGSMIKVDRSNFPDLEDGEYYWYQLQGLLVETKDGCLLGKVDHLMETGSNDVLVVRQCAGSIDQKERLIPYIPGQYVDTVDLQEELIRVDWDPEF